MKYCIATEGNSYVIIVSLRIFLGLGIGNTDTFDYCWFDQGFFWNVFVRLQEGDYH